MKEYLKKYWHGQSDEYWINEEIGSEFSKWLEKVDTREKVNKLDNISFNFLGRSGIVWNNTHWYAGASSIFLYED